MSDKILNLLAQELVAQPAQVRAAIELLDGGATVPFIARYRKEVTGGLDDIQLRLLEDRLGYLRELEARRAAVIASVREQGKLTDALHAQLAQAITKQELEDLYLPYKPRRRTKATIAREAGLEPLADSLFSDPTQVPLELAAAYILSAKTELGDDFTSAQACLDGARDILSERWAEDAALLAKLRAYLWANGLFASQVVDGKQAEGEKFRDYFDYSEPLGRVPSHRALAVFRGRQGGLLDAKLALPPTPDAAPGAFNACEGAIAAHIGWAHAGRAADDFLRRCVGWTWKVKLALSLERDVFGTLRDAAEDTAITVFGDNLRDLLLAAPAGPRAVMGLDPGIRTGVKVAVVDATGKVLDTATVYPHEPRRDWDGALHVLNQLAAKHSVALISIGNGTASRETDKLAGDLLKQLPDLAMQKVVVSEAGASVYSASEFASNELPDLDVSLRGAVSIARRVQDPLAELVKIDPKSIGVGQYQHDVNQLQLAIKLDAIVEDCVNKVGVDVNTASAPLLQRVAGMSASTAKAIVLHREANGPFAERAALNAVSGLGAKTFEQAAGFLRILGGSNPLDASGVHPESYPLVEKLLAKLGKPLAEVMGKPDALISLAPETLVDDRFGLFTVKDVLAELEKPGRDPRGSFKVARLADGVEDIKHLQAGMILEGTVSNVAAFGAFVDLGVHQDGLIHVSELAHRFVKDAREVVKTGDIVKVRVVEVDVARKRIALSMKLQASLPKPVPSQGADVNLKPLHNNERKNYTERSQVPKKQANNQARKLEPSGSSAMADAFAKLRK